MKVIIKGNFAMGKPENPYPEYNENEADQFGDTWPNSFHKEFNETWPQLECRYPNGNLAVIEGSYHAIKAYFFPINKKISISKPVDCNPALYKLIYLIDDKFENHEISPKWAQGVQTVIVSSSTLYSLLKKTDVELINSISAKDGYLIISTLNNDEFRLPVTNKEEFTITEKWLRWDWLFADLRNISERPVLIDFAKKQMILSY